MVCSEPDCQLIARALAPSVIPSEACDRLLQAACVIDVPIGLIQHPTPAKPLPSLWLLRRGQLAAGGLDRRGRFTELFRVQAGEWVDVFGALALQPAWFRSLMATEPSELLALPIDAVLRIAQQHPAVGLAFGQVLAGQAQALRDGLTDARTRGLAARLARRILDETAGRDGAPQPVWQMAVRKQQLAQQLGVTSEALSRSLRQLSEQQLIAVRRYEIQVLNRVMLQYLSESRGPMPTVTAARGSTRRAPLREVRAHAAGLALAA
ncbi:Crp/Fnr family transcriptional regulator [Ideonella dechloratans]|uniref:Crp/Fnr family transcriptional regulator n=1 Tax=Ideonella dechloratans TaxID=36863 RepID=A0A643F6F9_IDEDE|nr:Crp/Fnr family transcriptional regulator [Ideonella dechloratans]KAB0573839.1 Crp/Fnr family transcriptional regulator [Ideonella dechloratans]UFU12407.1 Crp/Fnr family transcriptional regulator [Ideonella dechloratans]